MHERSPQEVLDLAQQRMALNRRQEQTRHARERQTRDQPWRILWVSVVGILLLVLLVLLILVILLILILIVFLLLLLLLFLLFFSVLVIVLGLYIIRVVTESFSIVFGSLTPLFLLGIHITDVVLGTGLHLRFIDQSLVSLVGTQRFLQLFLLDQRVGQVKL